MLYKADLKNWFWVSFFVIRKLGQILVLLAKSRKFLCYNLNLPVSVRCILLSVVGIWVIWSMLHTIQMFEVHVWLLLFFGVDLCEVMLLSSMFQRLKLSGTHPGHAHQWRTFTTMLLFQESMILICWVKWGLKLNTASRVLISTCTQFISWDCMLQLHTTFFFNFQMPWTKSSCNTKS